MKFFLVEASGTVWNVSGKFLVEEVEQYFHELLSAAHWLYLRMVSIYGIFYIEKLMK